MLRLADLRAHPVVVVAAHLDPRMEIEAFDWLLDPAERERLAILGPRRRREFAAGRALARDLVARTLDVAPPLVHFDVASGGRPSLRTPRSDVPLDINLSHAHGWLFVGLTVWGMVGVDLEGIGRVSPSVARRFFSLREIASVEALPEAERPAAYTHLWTVKEACLKALGTGLRVPLAAARASLASSGRWGRVRWRSVSVAPEVCATVALIGPGAQRRMHTPVVLRMDLTRFTVGTGSA